MSTPAPTEGKKNATPRTRKRRNYMAELQKILDFVQINRDLIAEMEPRAIVDTASDPLEYAVIYAKGKIDALDGILKRFNGGKS